MSGSPSPHTLKIKHKQYNEENKEVASQKVAKWEGARTRSSVNHKEEELAEWMEQITRRKVPNFSPFNLYNFFLEG
jgi:hypothetical protein